MIKNLIKNRLKKLPGFRKLVLFFNKVRRLEAEVSSLEAEVSQLEAETKRLETKMDIMHHRTEMKFRLMAEGLDNVKSEQLRALKTYPFEKPRLAVYTLLIGDYDELQTPFVVDPGCDYFCITDNPNLKSVFWKMIVVKNEEGLDNVRFQRKLKVMPHLFFTQYEHSLYVDASILIRGSVWEWIGRNTTGKPWLTFQHPDRDCIYQEAEACKVLQKDNSDLIDAQMARYRVEGYPEHNGLIWSAILYRRHMDPAVISLEEAWFEELLKGSRRDQLSFNYICWKNGFQYDACKEDYHLSFLWAPYHDGLPH